MSATKPPIIESPTATRKRAIAIRPSSTTSRRKRHRVRQSKMKRHREGRRDKRGKSLNTVNRIIRTLIRATSIRVCPKVMHSR
ncbi:hypothetical protein B0I35DRAFT_445990 [Stachybotrys elegans]|uniref:Uncharacterized protein n=1 Tax=Stachybotrys elegans TaxID=80388 RepID=A0A8K0WJZ6_9HYPO|nr:hypothetical protein B0I35DRAFT_445990 [Stachybotrys elegans]